TRRSRFRQLSSLLDRLNPVLRGWCAYFRHGMSAASFQYLDANTWRRVVSWLRKRHPGVSWASLRRRYLPGWRPTTHDGGTGFNSGTVTGTRCRCRGSGPVDRPARRPGPTEHLGAAGVRVPGRPRAQASNPERAKRLRQPAQWAWPATVDRARGLPPAGRAGLDGPGRARLRAGVVQVAPPPAGPRQARTLPARPAQRLNAH